MTTLPFPDFFLVGAPKAGTTALHAALATHPDLFLPRVKEPKFFLCDEKPPPASGQRGPGDLHSAQEWVWQRDRYLRLFADAPPGAVTGESSAFYLYDLQAQERIRRERPDARLVVLLRDPVDRAQSNWMHLWSDGLEPIGDFVEACRAEDKRVAAGWAPFWHYRRLGRYGGQLEHLYSLFPREQVLVARYRELVDLPGPTIDRVCAFLGVRTGLVAAPKPENTRPYVPDTAVNRALASGVRVGARAGAHLPPRVWRTLSRPLLAALHHGGGHRPSLSVAERREVLAPLVDDIRLLERVTGSSFEDWLGDGSRGAFSARRVPAVGA
jgi:hypothetical protein